MAQYGEQYGSEVQGTDRYGSEVQGTDRYGSQVQGTDRYGTDQYGTDQYGSQVQGTDRYGSQVQNMATIGEQGAYGTGTGITDETAAGLGGQQPHLRRSGSSGSSSSEDDGQGGRRKKGLKEKLTGGHKESDEATATVAPGSGYGYEGGKQPQQEHENKGIMEKIKDKLPGVH